MDEEVRESIEKRVFESLVENHLVWKDPYDGTIHEVTEQTALDLWASLRVRCVILSEF